MLIIDRREDTGNSNESRSRFFERIKKDLTHSLKVGSNQTDLTGLTPQKFQVNKDLLIEPAFIFDNKIKDDQEEQGEVVILNTAYNKGDEIDIELSDMLMALSLGGQGLGQEDNEGSEEFLFDITKEELLELFADTLELPNFIKTELTVLDQTKLKHGGLTKNGLPSNLNVYKTYSEAFGRRIAIKGVIQEEIDKLESEGYIRENLIELDDLYKKLESIPFFDDTDLRYNTRVPTLTKIGAAVVFFICDVSGSMSHEMKEAAKKFFYMFYLFISSQYTNTEVVFIVHTDEAKEITEKEFFSSAFNGATRFYPSYELMNNIILNRYPPEKYNIYYSHISDSDTTYNDLKSTYNLLQSTILSKIRFGTYIHITNDLYGAYAPGGLLLSVRDRILSLKPKNRVVWEAMDTTIDPYRILFKLFAKKEKK